VSFAARLIATDLDGTLWGKSLELHPATREALAELSRRDVTVIAATGRRPRSALEGFADNEILLPAVLLDGTLGEDFAEGTRFHEAFFPAEAADRIIVSFLEAGVQPCVYIDDPDLDLLVGPEPSTDPGHLESVAVYARQTDLAAGVAEHPVLAFTVIGAERSTVAPLAARINSMGVAEATLVADSYYGGTSLSVIPAEVSKWSGVAAFCQERGIPPDAVLAVGDSHNDLAMLRHAGFAVAPTTAAAEVLAVADTIIDGPDDGGWAQLLDLLA